jgi:hypothetical protein
LLVAAEKTFRAQNRSGAKRHHSAVAPTVSAILAPGRARRRVEERLVPPA